MPRGNSRKPQSPSTPVQGAGVLRMAKAVPTMERPVPASAAGPEPASNNGLPCSGRCGHCDCHPCQLHAPI